jgi:hypothetical protein
VRVCGNGSSYGQPVRAGLFLGYSPRRGTAILECQITFNQLWPLDPSFHLQNSALAIQMEHAIQLPDIDQQSIGAELLSTHRVPPARNRDYLSILSGSSNDGLHLCLGSWLENCVHPGGIELGMNIIDQE